MYVTMPISGGHLNPAISISAYVSKRLSAVDMAGYVVAQVVGAILAAFVLRGLAPKSAFQFASGGVPALGQGISLLKGAGIELVLTFFVTFTFWAVCMDHRRTPRASAFTQGPVAVGLVIVVAGLAGASFTGAAVNPARWLGSAVAGTHFADWLVWVAGPLLGALLGSLAYEAFFLPIPSEVAAQEAEEEEEELEEGDDVTAEDLELLEEPAPPPSETAGD